MKKGMFMSAVLVFLILVGCKTVKKIIPPEQDIRNTKEGASSKDERDFQGYIEPDDQGKSQGENETAEESGDDEPETKPSKTLKKLVLSKGYTVHVRISDQKVYIYRDGEPVKTMICSTGVEGNDTPLGNFKIKHRDTWFFSRKFNQGGKYWVGFIGKRYLFHSVPASEDGRIIEEEAHKLGSPASHGCIRLSLDDAKWFYDTIPDGADVLIEK